MEVEVVGYEGARPDSVVMIRAGHTRRQAKLGAGLPFQFPSLPVNANPFKVEVFQPLCSKSLTLSPDAENYVVKMPPTVDGNQRSELRLQILDANAPRSATAGLEHTRVPASVAPASEMTAEADNGGWTEVGGGDAPDRKAEIAANARGYLANKDLLNFVQEMLAQVIKEKPKDPFAFMSEHARSRMQVTCGQSKASNGAKATDGDDDQESKRLTLDNEEPTFPCLPSAAGKSPAPPSPAPPVGEKAAAPAAPPVPGGHKAALRDEPEEPLAKNAPPAGPVPSNEESEPLKATSPDPTTKPSTAEAKPSSPDAKPSTASSSQGNFKFSCRAQSPITGSCGWSSNNTNAISASISPESELAFQLANFTNHLDTLSVAELVESVAGEEGGPRSSTAPAVCERGVRHDTIPELPPSGAGTPAPAKPVSAEKEPSPETMLPKANPAEKSLQEPPEITQKSAPPAAAPVEAACPEKAPAEMPLKDTPSLEMSRDSALKKAAPEETPGQKASIFHSEDCPWQFSPSVGCMPQKKPKMRPGRDPTAESVEVPLEAHHCPCQAPWFHSPSAGNLYGFPSVNRFDTPQSSETGGVPPEPAQKQAPPAESAAPEPPQTDAPPPASVPPEPALKQAPPAESAPPAPAQKEAPPPASVPPEPAQKQAPPAESAPPAPARKEAPPPASAAPEPPQKEAPPPAKAANQTDELMATNANLRAEVERLKAMMQAGPASSILDDNASKASSATNEIPFSFKISGMNYEMLDAKKELKAAVTKCITEHVAERVGVGPEMVEVCLSKGSVQVDAVLRVLDEQQGQVIKKRMMELSQPGETPGAPGNFQVELMRKLREIPGNEEIWQPPSVSKVEVGSKHGHRVHKPHRPRPDKTRPHSHRPKPGDGIDFESIMSGAVDSIYEDLHQRNLELRSSYHHMATEHNMLRTEHQNMKQMLVRVCYGLEGFATDIRSACIGQGVSVPGVSSTELDGAPVPTKPIGKTPCLESENKKLREATTALFQANKKLRHENDVLHSEISSHMGSRNSSNVTPRSTARSGA